MKFLCRKPWENLALLGNLRVLLVIILGLKLISCILWFSFYWVFFTMWWYFGFLTFLQKSGSKNSHFSYQLHILLYILLEFSLFNLFLLYSKIIKDTCFSRWWFWVLQLLWLSGLWVMTLQIFLFILAFYSSQLLWFQDFSAIQQQLIWVFEQMELGNSWWSTHLIDALCESPKPLAYFYREFCFKKTVEVSLNTTQEYR